MDRVLPVAKPQRTPAVEQYDPRIRGPVESVEEHFRKYVEAKLRVINRKILDYARYRVIQRDSMNKAELARPTFVQADFQFDLNQLTPLVNIGVGYQRQRIDQTLRAQNINPTVANRRLDQSYIDIQQFLGQRQDFLSTTIEDTTLDTVYRITEDGINKGLTFNDIASNLSAALGFDGTRSQMIARTETNWALNESTRGFLANAGVKEFKISPAADACDECIEAAKQTYGVDQQDILPWHPRCRCVLSAVIPSDWTQIEEHNVVEPMPAGPVLPEQPVITQEVAPTEFQQQLQSAGVESYQPSSFESQLVDKLGVSISTNTTVLADSPDAVAGYQLGTNTLTVNLNSLERLKKYSGEDIIDRTIHHEIGHALDGRGGFAIPDIVGRISNSDTFNEQIEPEMYQLIQKRIYDQSPQDFQQALGKLTSDEWIAALRDGKAITTDAGILNLSSEYRDYLSSPRELFADAYAVYQTDPEYLQSNAPNTYKYFQNLTTRGFKF